MLVLPMILFGESGSIDRKKSMGIPTYSVRCEVKLPDGTVFVRVVVARLAQDPSRPVVVLGWGDGEAEQMTGKQ